MMKKKYSVFALLAVLVLVLSACGAAASKRTDADVPYPSAERSGAAPNGLSSDSSYYIPASEADHPSVAPDAGTPGDTGPSAVFRDNTKVIYIADASLETTEFEKTCAALRQLAKQLGGYMESEDVSNSSSGYSNSNRKASFVVRIPAEGYEQFISGMGDGCKIISIKQTKEDVGAEYFDVEQKLETLNNKRERLEALLTQAENMSDIIELENALSYTEYEINCYKSTLNRYDSLINFSTVNIFVREVSNPGEGIDDDPGFFERLGRNFSEGFEGFTDALESLAYWFSYNLLTIIVIVVIIVVIVKIHPIRRIKKASAKKAEITEKK